MRVDSAKRNLSLYETKGSRERDRKTEKVRTKELYGPDLKEVLLAHGRN